VSQAICDEITCAEAPEIKNKPTLTPTPAPRAEQVSGGTAARRAEQVSDEQLTGEQTTATRSPAVSCSTDQLAKSLPGASDQRPMTKEEIQKKRFDALPYTIKNEIEDMRRQLWHHNGRPYLRKDQVSEFVAFIDKHLGEDSVGPESCLRSKRQNP
jgi:hypothetical protein